MADGLGLLADVGMSTANGRMTRTTTPMGAAAPTATPPPTHDIATRSTATATAHESAAKRRVLLGRATRSLLGCQLREERLGAQLAYLGARPPVKAFFRLPEHEGGRSDEADGDETTDEEDDEASNAEQTGGGGGVSHAVGANGRLSGDDGGGGGLNGRRRSEVGRSDGGDDADDAAAARSAAWAGGAAARDAEPMTEVGSAEVHKLREALSAANAELVRSRATATSLRRLLGQTVRSYCVADLKHVAREKTRPPPPLGAWRT